MGKLAAQAEKAGADDRLLSRMEAVILSMTPRERAKPELLNARRKIRIANGAGTTVQDVNRLIKMHQEMATAMKKIRKMGGMKGLAGLIGRMGGGIPGLGGIGGIGGMPPGFDRFKR
jgi:signal recognition particle subunit SRP54